MLGYIEKYVLGFSSFFAKSFAALFDDFSQSKLPQKVHMHLKVNGKQGD